MTSLDKVPFARLIDTTTVIRANGFEMTPRIQTLKDKLIAKGWTIDLQNVKLCKMPGGDWRDFAKANKYPRPPVTDAMLDDLCHQTNLGSWWYRCKSTQPFPLVDVSKVTNFGGAWGECSLLTSFPLLDVSSGKHFAVTWQGCSSLTSFPLLDVSKGTNFQMAWSKCSSLTSFPLLNVSNGTDFQKAWQGCNLNEQSVLNIMTSLDKVPFARLIDTTTVIRANGFKMTSRVQSLLNKLQAKGWTIDLQRVRP
jgi:hypothetical protein